jgi:hypothetical protein
MRLGLGVPSVYIVPVERFCREMGPALGINLAEFEFPAYFNYFVRNKSCTLVVDSEDAENNIRRVFGETLLGPAQFRDHLNPKPNEDEDFDPSFPREARPNFYKEFYHFRTAEKSTNYQELTIDTLLEFCHFKSAQHGREGSSISHDKLGVPPKPPTFSQGKESHGDERVSQATRRHTFFNKDNDIKFEAFQESYRKLSLESDISDDKALEEVLPLRRSMSNPDLRMKKVVSIEPDAVSIPSSPTVAKLSDRDASTSKKVSRRGSIDSNESAISNTGQSRDGVSKASGISWASFMLTSDDEEDPSRNSWMYSQAKWLGKLLLRTL